MSEHEGIDDHDSTRDDRAVEEPVGPDLTERVAAVEESLNSLAASITEQNVSLQRDIGSFTDSFPGVSRGDDSSGITAAETVAGSDSGDDSDQDDPGFTGWADSATVPEWAGLVQWVDWLSATYQLGDACVRSCWPAHGAAVEELAGLKMAWEAAIGGCMEKEWMAAESLAYWHDRYLPGVLARLRALHGMNACKSQHEKRPRPLVTDTRFVVIHSTGEVPDLAGSTR